MNDAVSVVSYCVSVFCPSTTASSSNQKAIRLGLYTRASPTLGNLLQKGCRIRQERGRRITVTERH